MEKLFTYVRHDGVEALTQMGQLFLELENAHKALTSLSYNNETDNPFAFNCAVDSAIKQFNKVLNNLRLHCASVEMAAQMAGVRRDCQQLADEISATVEQFDAMIVQLGGSPIQRELVRIYLNQMVG